MKKRFSGLTIFLMILSWNSLNAQPQNLSLQDCIDLALKQNLNIKSGTLEVVRDKALRKAAFNPEKTNFSLEQDPTEGGSSGNAISVSQSFSWPGVYIQRSKMLKQQVVLSEKGVQITRSKIIREVKLNYYDYLYQNEKIRVLTYLDSLYQDFSSKAEIRAKTGEGSRLEALAVQNRKAENAVLLQQALSDKKQVLLAMSELLNSSEDLSLKTDSLQAIDRTAFQDSIGISQNPKFDFLEQNIRLATARVKLARSKLYPDFTVGYSRQFLINGFNPAGINREYFPGTRTGGFQIGLALPLFAGSYAAGINAEKTELGFAKLQLEIKNKELKTQWEQALQEYEKYKQSFLYYKNSGLSLAKEQLRVAQISFEKGEIGYVEYIQNLAQASDSRLNYLTVLQQLNAAVIQLQYLQGNGLTNY